MPKRLLDDSLFASPSLAACSPRCQDAFPRIILCADDFGCFDANPRVLRGRAWPLRPDVSEADVSAWLSELEAVGMAQLWEQDGRRYCYLTGWFGPHGQRRREEYDRKKAPHGSKRRTPMPPAPRIPANSRAGKRGKGPAVSRETPHVPASAGAGAGAGAVPIAHQGDDHPGALSKPMAALGFDAEVAAQTAALDAEAEGRGKPTGRKARGNGADVLVSEAAVLAVLAQPLLSVEVAQRLGLPSSGGRTSPGVKAVEAVLLALRDRGAVRAVGRGKSEVTTWERTEEP